MGLMVLRTAGGERTISVHDGAESEAQSIFNFEEYDLRTVGFQNVATVVDIGGHVGLFTLFIRTHYPEADIHCFEPLAVNLELLRQNVAGDNRVHVRDFGLSSYRHEADIWLSPAYGHGAASTFRTRDHTGEKQTAKFMVAAEEIAGIEGRISILKIDTEGHELRILRNIDPHLDRIDSIFLEVHSDRALAKILDLLEGRFTPVHFGGGMGNRYKVIFVNTEAIAAQRVRAQIAPEIFYN
jgi:FkbM family methyltransferase